MVGLGNPGIEYQFTPHNAGFLAIDRLAEQGGVAVNNRRCRALTATTRIAGRDVVLAKPETYMNLSGISVQALVKELDAIPARDLIVIYDEVALSLGSLRIRERAVPAAITGLGPSPVRWAVKSGCGFVLGSLLRGMRRRREHGGGARIMCSRP